MEYVDSWIQVYEVTPPPNANAYAGRAWIRFEGEKLRSLKTCYGATEESARINAEFALDMWLLAKDEQQLV